MTGCPNSSAQHYLGDIGLLGTQVEAGDDLVEGYHVFVGGGYGAEQHLIQMSMRIDEPRHQHATGGIDEFVTSRRRW